MIGRSLYGRPYTVSWTLPTHPVVTYRRNMLASVIFQLRFQPILKVSSQIAAFQDRIRVRFPRYETHDSQQVEIGASGITVKDLETIHKFQSLDNSEATSLGTTSFSLEYVNHEGREQLFSDVSLVIDALRDTYSPIVPTRLGLRYVNIIQRKQVEEDLQRKLDWSDLLSSGFSAVPSGIASLDNETSYGVEVSSPCHHGKMTVRYGVLPESLNGVKGQHFRLDTDRFIDTDLKLDDVPRMLEDFSSDIFNVFMQAAGTALIDWMGRGTDA
jgi:uncharacterized protein (TIGR04255 family)